MICNCAQHCPDSPYHDASCCGTLDCQCWCHGRWKVDYMRNGRERTASFHEQESAMRFADMHMGLVRPPGKRKEGA